MKTTLLAISAGCAMLLFTAGCATSMNSVENAQATGHRKMVSDKRVITDAGLYDRVSVVGINTATGPAGFLKIQVEVLNTTSSLRKFTYRVEWFDADGMLINLPTTTATPRALEGGESGMITATAPTDKAKDFKIKFLESLN